MPNLAIFDKKCDFFVICASKMIGIKNNSLPLHH